MGGGASKVKVPAPPIRSAGDFLNLTGLRATHEVVIPPPFGRSHKQAICRCWLSKRFPMCDNTHQKLNKIGCDVGPAVLEVLPVDVKTKLEGGSKIAGTNVSAASGTDRPIITKLGGASAVAVGGAAAYGLNQDEEDLDADRKLRSQSI